MCHQSLSLSLNYCAAKKERKKGEVVVNLKQGLTYLYNVIIILITIINSSEGSQRAWGSIFGLMNLSLQSVCREGGPPGSHGEMQI